MSRRLKRGYEGNDTSGEQVEIQKESTRKRHKSQRDADDEPLGDVDHVSPASTADKNMLEDAVDGEGEDIDDNTEAKIQAAKREMECMRGEHFSLAGILQSIQLDRFMSHYCFSYDFGPNVNIIHGANGSGKSAIVAALQIGLGAHAKTTERGTQLKDLIMHNERSAVITIRIHNRRSDNTSFPDMTYRYDKQVDGQEPKFVYGPLIIIELRILRSGANAWAVKNWRGKPVDLEGRTARAEVRNIIHHFGIMASNPVAILTQSKSKAFFGKLRPSSHFKLYKEATLLGPLENELKATAIVAHKLQLDLTQKKNSFLTTEKDFQNLSAQLKEAQELKKIDQRIADAETLYAWTSLEESQNVVAAWERRTEEEFHQVAEKAKIAWDNAIADMQQVNKTVTDVNADVQSATQLSKQAFESMRNSRREEASLKLELENHNRLVNEYAIEIREGKESIVQTKENLKTARLEALAGKGQKEQISHKLKEVSEIVVNLEKSLAEAKHEAAAAHEKKYPMEETVREAQADMRNIRREYEQKREEQLIATNSDSDLRRFGHSFPSLVRRIEEKQTHFHEPPIGPIGQYVKVLDQSWAPAVELCIGVQTLQSFIVHTANDARMLERLLPENQRPTIIVSNLRRGRYRIPEEDKPQLRDLGHCTMLDMLNIQNDAVFNVLVDHSSVERIVLVSTEEDITELGWSRLQNLTEVWNRKGERAYTRNGSNTFRTTRNIRNAGRILLTDRTQYLEALQREAQSLAEQCRHQEAVVTRAVSNSDRVRSEVARAARVATSSQRALSDARLKKSGIEAQLHEATTAFDATPFENEIGRLERTVAEKERRKDAKIALIAVLRGKIADIKEACRSAANAARAKKEELSKLSKKLENLNGALTRGKLKLRTTKARAEKARSTLQRALSEIQNKKLEVAEKMEVALRFGARPQATDAKKNPSSKIHGRLTKLKEMLSTEQDRRGGRSAEDMEMEFLRARKTYRDMKTYLQRIEFYDTSLQKGIRERIIQKKKLERKLRTTVREKFNVFLGVRGHTGQIAFKKDEQGVFGLYITARMASHRKRDGQLYETKDLRSLSGGERSFTTLAFLLALAEVTHNPIRVFDEIDVFQDAANRRASFKTLVKHCSEFLSDKQFIIVTPLALPDIQPSDSVRVAALEPPKRRPSDRNQTTIQKSFSK